MRYTFDSINALARDVHPDFRVCSYNTTWMLSVRVNEYGASNQYFKPKQPKI